MGASHRAVLDHLVGAPHALPQPPARDPSSEGRRDVRRKAALLLSLSGLLTASTLAATGAATASPARVAEAPAQGDWEVADTELLNELLAGEGMATLADDETPQELPWAIQSARTGRYVAAERTLAEPNTGVLRARSSDVNGSWELFDMHWHDDETISLNSHANDLWVATERNYPGNANGVLRARSESVGSWERYILWYSESLDRWAIQSVVNGLFVATEINYTGDLAQVLRARSEDINGSWEQFQLY
jgi:hypothetical protein